MIAAKIIMKKLSVVALFVGVLFVTAPVVKAEEAAKEGAPVAAAVETKKGDHAGHHGDHAKHKKGDKAHKDMKCECGKDAKECKGKKCAKGGDCDCGHHGDAEHKGEHKEGDKPAEAPKK